MNIFLVEWFDGVMQDLIGPFPELEKAWEYSERRIAQRSADNHPTRDLFTYTTTRSVAP